MPYLNQTAASFVTKRKFELLLLGALLFETLHLIGLFDQRAAVDGTTLAILFTFGVPWIVLLLGLAVTRRGSMIAKWLLAALAIVALFSAIRIGTDDWSRDPAIFAGAIAGICQLAAVLMLFTPAGRIWTR